MIEVTVPASLAALTTFLACWSSELKSGKVGITLRKTAEVPWAAALKESGSSKVPTRSLAPSCSSSTAFGFDGSRTRAFTCIPAARRCRAVPNP
ncbi:hypothetical protein BDV30DRAFT_210756 [Aspergillus minisclerotigenes]|uniref:Uncharacterized protein n=1 Tax=Aspergillus minisclerotigenes TaxID=656917 RepID=A0A5N6J330_9EURO|nr:hypothetical protein BDV30DRAFT_210756 [Aspergillus minisclerotigenes]